MSEQQNGRDIDNPQALHVTLILDESGSMQECKGAAIAGFNHYIATLKNEPAQTQITLTLFNSGKTEVRYRNVPVAAVHELDVETYRPNDTTPLYDAIGHTLTAARQQVPADGRKLCVVLTDGLENASQQFDRKQIFAMIKEAKQEGWIFLYLGADHDVWAAGESLGVAQENRISFDKKDVGDTFNKLSANTARYRRRNQSEQAPIWDDRPSDPSGAPKR
jgi:Mg-chelatase subunit ChlD